MGEVEKGNYKQTINMKIEIIAVGKKHDREIAESIEDYSKRINHYAPLDWRLIPASNIDDECSSILKSLDERDFPVLLDERGKEYDSIQFSELIQKRLNEGVHRVVFIIGGAYGVNELVKEKAKAIVSLSRLTFPHQLVRLVLAEQIYRSFSILKGEKYHHI